MRSRDATSLVSVELEPTHLVGVGASAGGLEAIERLFRELPGDTGMAFVIVQHLSPDFRSLMDELLARWTSMPIHRVDEGMEVHANNIYLIPPKMEISITGSELHLACKNPSEGLSLPIDVFFESIAREWQSRSVAIVLSGTGSDGSRGIRDVHEAGGLVISQSIETAKFDGMPRSAERTGVVDMILSPEQIANTLARYACFPVDDKSQLLEDRPAIVDEGTMNRLLRLLREECGIDFAFYKTATVMRRIERRVLLSQSVDFDDYVDRVAEDRDELNSLYKDLLIGVTHFFRDPAAFDRLANEILPPILQELNPGDQFRAWVCGCATGEEAYSLAILVCELLEELNLQLDVKIFATDVHRASLELAGAGIYSEASLSELSNDRRRRFFARTSRGYQLTPDVRQMIVFAPHNVIADAPFTKLDFVSCRNLLIYFQPDVQARVISLFHFALKKNGVLFLGPSEALGAMAGEFSTIDGHWKMYRKKRDVRLSRDLQVPVKSEVRSTQHPMRLPPIREFSPSNDRSLAAAYDQLLDRFMPSGVLLDHERKLVHMFGDSVAYVQLRSGRPTADALDWFAPRLRAAAAGGIHRASRERKPVHFNGLRIGDDSDSPLIRMAVIPLVSKEDELTHFMITFETLEISTPVSSTELDVGEVSRDRMLMLEGELRVMRENLQATIEELETSNEELQATNEELVASNEELQSTNEELHSVNEELYTVNGEYQKKIAELTEITDDLNHLFENLDAGLLFLDAGLSVRKFTPSLASVFSLLPQDIGRSFHSFTHRLDRPQLAVDIESVIATQQPFEKEVRTKDGAWYLMQIQPYQSRGRVDGAVIELFEITQVKLSRGQLKRSIARMQAALQHADLPIAVQDKSGKYLLANDDYARLVNCSADRLVRKSDFEVLPRLIADATTTARQRAIEGASAVMTDPLVFPSAEQALVVVMTPIHDDAGVIDSVTVCLKPVNPPH